MLSNRQIDKLGEKLKNEIDLTSNEYQELLNWRNSFSASLDYYHLRLKDKIEPDGILAIAKRMKRIESIRLKLKRFSTMRLSTLQDIAGLRVILKNKDNLEKAFINIRNSESIHKLKKLDDYHHRPKDDGYRGIHIVYQTPSSRMVEIQFRTELEHILATAVEVYGTLKKVSFKTGKGEKEWREFFKVLSSFFSIIESQSPLKEHERFSKKQILSKLKKYIKQLKAIERLNAATNSIEIIVNKRHKGRTGKYALLELDYEKQTTRIDIFTKAELSKAIEEYTRKELSLKEGSSKNIVLVNIESVEEIQKTYPNYFLDTKNLLKILSEIVLSENVETTFDLVTE